MSVGVSQDNAQDSQEGENRLYMTFRHRWIAARLKGLSKRLPVYGALTGHSLRRICSEDI